MSSEVHVIGGGLAGCEAAWQIANAGINVRLYEMRDGACKTPAHKTDGLAELVCSNSFRSDDSQRSAIGLLHQEMRMMGSVIMSCADKHKIPAGGALAVDREGFSLAVSQAMSENPRITIVREEIKELLLDTGQHTIIASGPLTSDSLSESILKITGEEYLSFFDALAPVVHRESIDFNKAWFQSRYDKVSPESANGGDYINCALSKEQYEHFIASLCDGEKIEFKEWEKDTPYFDGCLPIEVMAERGSETLRFGPMKPVGLTNPHLQDKPYAVVQLRQDNKLATLYNIVGFQTKLKYHEQTRVFRMIPGLENAEFARLGGLHRNTFINSPVLLDRDLRLKKHPTVRFAGQITGVEGYVESAACGLMAGIFAAAQCLDKPVSYPPVTTALGALLEHITNGATSESFQPMNINFGLLPPLKSKMSKKDRKQAYCSRALDDLNSWLAPMSERAIAV